MRATIAFTAGVVAGEGRGASLGSPTMNLDLAEVPKELREGVYAARANGSAAVMHYGPRPTLGLQPSCEIHVIDGGALSPAPGSIAIEIVERLRDVRNFGSEEALKEQIAEDVERARRVLS